MRPQAGVVVVGSWDCPGLGGLGRGSLGQERTCHWQRGWNWGGHCLAKQAGEVTPGNCSSSASQGHRRLRLPWRQFPNGSGSSPVGVQSLVRGREMWGQGRGSPELQAEVRGRGDMQGMERWPSPLHAEWGSWGQGER